VDIRDGRRRRHLSRQRLPAGTHGDEVFFAMELIAGGTRAIDDALPYLQRAARSCVALEVPFEHTQVQLVLGQALAARGRRDEACAALGVVLARWGHARPRSVTADRARELAQSLGCRMAQE
jgi:serine/threonine-protein kinase